MMLSVKEVAEMFGCGRTLINRLIREGDLPSYKIGGIRRIPESAIRHYLNSVSSHQ